MNKWKLGFFISLSSLSSQAAELKPSRVHGTVIPPSLAVSQTPYWLADGRLLVEEPGYSPLMLTPKGFPRKRFALARSEGTITEFDVPDGFGDKAQSGGGRLLSIQNGIASFEIVRNEKHWMKAFTIADGKPATITDLVKEQSLLAALKQDKLVAKTADARAAQSVKLLLENLAHSSYDAENAPLHQFAVYGMNDSPHAGTCKSADVILRIGLTKSDGKLVMLGVCAEDAATFLEFRNDPKLWMRYKPGIPALRHLSQKGS